MRTDIIVAWADWILTLHLCARYFCSVIQSKKDHPTVMGWDSKTSSHGMRLLYNAILFPLAIPPQSQGKLEPLPHVVTSGIRMLRQLTLKIP